jgi:PilZ domain
LVPQQHNCFASCHSHSNSLRRDVLFTELTAVAMAPGVHGSILKGCAMESAVNWEELGIEANKDRRREARIPLAIPVEVTGFDSHGKFFCEATKTVDISESGCSFALKRSLERGGVIAIKVAVKDRKKKTEQRPFLYQVARSTPEGERWIIGAAKLQPESVWYVAFPKTEAHTQRQL